MQIRKTKIYTAAILTVVYSLVVGLIVISCFAKDEGSLGNNIILNFLADYLFFLAVPAFILISVLAKAGLSNSSFFTIGILLSSLIYAMLTVLIYFYYQKRKVMAEIIRKNNNEEKS